MPLPFLSQLCDALASALNTQFAGKFTAKRSWSPDQALEDYPDDALTVAVAPLALTQQRADRASDFRLHSVGVGFRRRVPESAGTPEELRLAQDAFVDEQVEQVEAVADWLARKKSITVGNVALSSPESLEISPVCAADDLRELGLFTSVISLVYRERRSV